MAVSASQAECRGFNSPFPLRDNSPACEGLGSFLAYANKTVLDKNQNIEMMIY